MLNEPGRAGRRTYSSAAQPERASYPRGPPPPVRKLARSRVCGVIDIIDYSRRLLVGSKAKYAPDINFEDISTYVREHRRSTGYDACIVLHSGTGPGGADWAEVRLVPASSTALSAAEIVTRGPFPSRNVSRQMSALLHLVAQAYADLEAHPWLWSPEQRKAARGEVVAGATAAH